MIDGFKKFILRGNVIDLAVGVVIGTAFAGVVDNLVKGVLTPFIGLITKPDFSTWIIHVGKTDFLVGDVVNSLISFVLVAAAIYFFVVLPMNKVMMKIKKDEVVEVSIKSCHECLSEIPKLAKRCAHCSQAQN